MKRKIPDSEYAALAELRYRIRQFVHGSDEGAEAAGLEPQQYQLLLALRAVPLDEAPSIRFLAERMLLRHHSAVGLIDRLEAQGYVRRRPNPQDERSVLIQLLPRGERVLQRVVRNRLHELRETGDSLAAAIVKILKTSRAKHTFALGLRGAQRKPAVRSVAASRK